MKTTILLFIIIMITSGCSSSRNVYEKDHFGNESNQDIKAKALSILKSIRSK